MENWDRGRQKKRRTETTIGGVEEVVCEYERRERRRKREGIKTQLSFSSQRPMRLRIMIKRRRAMEKKKERERGRGRRGRGNEVQLGVTSQAGGAVFPLSTTGERTRPVILVSAVSGALQTHRTPLGRLTGSMRYLTASILFNSHS